LQEVEPKYLAAVFNVWALGTMPLILNRLLSIDGKSIKCTSSGGNTSSQNFTSLVSVYDDESAGVVQIQIMENKKQSEIGVAQNLISELATLPSGQTFSLDALHTKTATVAAIAAAGHHCLIAVKQNRLHWVKDLTFHEDYRPCLGGHAPVNWSIFFNGIVTLVRRSSLRTFPQAPRLWANQVDTVFSFLV
jgi:hypothetical protein